MKQRRLRTKWMVITTTITFTTILIFSIIIIFYLSNALRNNELEEAQRSSNDIGSLFEETPYKHISTVDLNASLGNFQKVIVFNDKGKELIDASNDNSITYHPQLHTHHLNKVKVVKNHHTAYFVLTQRIDSAKFHGYSVVIHSLENYNTLVNSLYFFAVTFGILATVITALISYFFSSQIAKPLVTLSDKMQLIRRNGFQEKIQLPTNYVETDNLIETFNAMMTRLEDSFNQQRQFVEDASHELRTPLQIIQGHLNLIKRWGKESPEVLEESLNISLEEMTRITKLVEELLLLTKDDVTQHASEVECVDINKEIKQRIKSLARLHEDYTFEFEPYPKPLLKEINRYQLEQILIIFIDNAIKYDQNNKYIKIETQLRNKQISINITDHGVGIPQEDLEFIFDRFYRVDKSRSRKPGGNGLGLSIAKKLIEHNGGSIVVESVVGEYTTFHIRF